MAAKILLQVHFIHPSIRSGRKYRLEASKIPSEQGLRAEHARVLSPGTDVKNINSKVKKDG